MNQHQQILELLSDNKYHCGVELRESLYCYDARKRISELNQRGITIKSEPCKGRCGRNHNSSIHWYCIPIKKEMVGMFELEPLNLTASKYGSV